MTTQTKLGGGVISVNKAQGFIISKHIFGNNELVRNGNKLYYLKWDWNESKTVHDIIFIKANAYVDIRNRLLEVIGTNNCDVLDDKTTGMIGSKYYKTTDENLELIRQYLIVNNILKED